MSHWACMGVTTHGTSQSAPSWQVPGFDHGQRQRVSGGRVTRQRSAGWLGGKGCRDVATWLSVTAQIALWSASCDLSDLPSH